MRSRFAMAQANLIGQVLDDKYLIDRQLGRGGMGAVYLATHLGTDRPVAIKVITPQFMAHDEFVERFRREAKATGRLRHPNVVNVTDFGFAPIGKDRIAYLVMEYLGGCTLGEILAEETHLEISWIVDILEQTCAAIDEAHRQGVIHRDLKPDNIWLEPNSRGGYTVKVLDFGLAKLGDTVPEPGEVTSTPAPETSSLPDVRGELTTARPDGGRTQVAAAKVTAHGETDLSESATRIQTGVSAEERGGESTACAPEGSRTQAAAAKMTAHGEGDLSESATRIQTRDAAEEERTLIQPQPAASQLDLSEAATMLKPPAAETEAGMRPEDKQTGSVAAWATRPSLLSSTAADDGLTRVGSILGTPLYMSPEQCRSEPLDARTDIYSLGVIAYQMLAGETPFSGDPHSVMTQHIESAPPQLREKRRKVPKKLASLVMSALAKNPLERPVSPAAFASALRANSEGIGALVRRSFALYSEHFMQFFRASLLLNLPLIALAIGQLVIEVLARKDIVSPTANRVTEVSFGLLNFIVTFLT
ncbi:MAG TPA: protein kinase, partial [Blastocatellia bacterium]|nr:protein kinase [Blastocatellia bacterium]